MSKALVIDPDLSGHGATVRQYFLDTLSMRGVDVGTPTGWTCDVKALSPSAGVDDAIASGYALVIRSQTDVWTYKSEWDRAWDNGIPVVHAHGSNSPTELPEPPRLSSAITVGGEDPNTPEEETSYGPGLELDAITYDSRTEQSYATPTVAAVLADFYGQVGAEGISSWWDARALVRQACQGYADGWSEQAGYGVLLHDASKPAGVELQPPVDVVATKVDDSHVDLSCRPFDSSNQVRTVWQGNGIDIGAIAPGTGAALTYEHNGLTSEVTFEAFSEGASGQRNDAGPVARVTVSGLQADALNAPTLRRVGHEVGVSFEVPDGWAWEVRRYAELWGGAPTVVGTGTGQGRTVEVIDEVPGNAVYRVAFTPPDGEEVVTPTAYSIARRGALSAPVAVY